MFFKILTIAGTTALCGFFQIRTPDDGHTSPGSRYTPDNRERIQTHSARVGNVTPVLQFCGKYSGEELSVDELNAGGILIPTLREKGTSLFMKIVKFKMTAHIDGSNVIFEITGNSIPGPILHAIGKFPGGTRIDLKEVENLMPNGDVKELGMYVYLKK